MMAIDQLLFGYSDGHGLLASSRPLTASQLLDVLPHTDSSFERSDERELVGVWIPSLEAYLLARIWSAPERPRPGAVWAHALLLTAEQLRGGGLTGLLGLFRRPGDELFDGYHARLPWPVPSRVSVPAEPLTRAIVWAALDAAGRMGVVLCDAPSEVETVIIALQGAIPAAARAQLSFRTRARARLGAGPYRLQVASALNGTPAERNELVIDARLSPPAPPPAWTNLLEDSAAAGRQRDFVLLYGAEDACTGAQASALAEIATLLDVGAEPDRIVRALVRSFPQAVQVPELRLSLLGRTGWADGLWQIGEEQRLMLLCDYATHFDIVALELEQRISSLARSNPEAALRLVERARRRSRPAAA